ncbi:hypothetical protein [Paraglaciecola sp. 25GB23A]|uniref:hypothetical protein n=1 Tax=Paraglaciecola sp. 25GB23A TaxID=3156068 RepID=UPI0032AF2EDC
MNPTIVRYFVALTALLMITTSMQALAVTTFARQTGLPCAACHAQTYPALNQFGRVFKANGYAISVAPFGSQDSVLSLKDSLNAGIVTKIRYQQSNGAGPSQTNDGEFQFPDELLLHIATRISNNIGAVIELNLNDGDPLMSGFKLPIIYNVSGHAIGGIPFSTSSQGAAYGFELLNTGAVRFSRVAEDRSAVSAQQYVGTATKAQGIAAVASNNQYFANISKWSPSTTGDNSGSLSATYVRLAATPQISGWDVGLGIQSWSGSATEPVLQRLVDTDAWAFDAQAQGLFMDMPLGLYLSYAESAGTPAGSIQQNLFNKNPHDRKAAAILGQLGVIPSKVTVLMSYRHGENGQINNYRDDAWMIGGTYSLLDNLQFQLNHTEYSGSAYSAEQANGTRMTTLMLYGAF